GIVVNTATTHLTVAGFTNPTVSGVAHSLTVTAKNAANGTDAFYDGTVQITSSDGSFTPVTYTFTTGAGADNGAHTFNLTLHTVGTPSFTATYQVTLRVALPISGIVVNTATTHLSVAGFTNPTVSGVAHSLTVTALNTANG